MKLYFTNRQQQQQSQVKAATSVLQQIVAALWQRWILWQKSICWGSTTSKQDVPRVMQEFNIESGYRLAGCSWGYYLASGFQMHNETVNWLSHSLGACLMLATVMNYTQELQGADPRDIGVMWLFGCASVLLHAASSIAHLLHNRSEHTHCCVFFIDNAAAGLAAFGCNLVNIAFLSTQSYYNRVAWLTLPVLVFGSIFLSASYSLALARYKRNYNAATALLMFGPAGAFVAFGCGPAVDKFIENLLFDAQHDLRPFLHIIVFVMAVTFYATYFPERCKRGHFDLIGHSHQWFHILATVSHYLLLTAIFQEIKRDSPTLYSKRDTSSLTLETAIYGFGVVAVFDAALILFYLKAFRYDSLFKSKAKCC